MIFIGYAPYPGTYKYNCMRKDDFIQLIDKYLSGTATPEESRLLEQYYKGLSTQERPPFLQEDEKNIQKELLEKIFQQIQPVLLTMPLPSVTRMPKRRWLWAAAAMLLPLICLTAWFALHSRRAPVARTTDTHLQQNDIAPGGNNAILTLAGGQQIVLDTAKGGTITRQGNFNVIKLEGGQLAYDQINKEDTNLSAAPAAITYNTLTTPRGGQYRVILSDGTKVWLNAASCLRYPTSFTGRERMIEIRGEAYFEVEKNREMPFIVRANGAVVQVLGTKFNVMAYGDEDELNTTLLEGGVKVSMNDVSKTLKPGQQARLTTDGKLTLVDDADIDQTLAWKDNLFSFNDADIHTVMRQIARWYDVDIQYGGKITQHFNGNISRAVNVSKVFAMLELTGSVHFRIEGRQIIVNP